MVSFADVDSASGRHFLAWPWVDGDTLDRLLVRNGTSSPAETTRWFAELADGLHTLHSAGIPHGMIRPRSILIGGDRQPRLLDLGVGGILTDNVTDERSMVDTLALACGSAAMADSTAPEVFIDQSAMPPAADAYSLDCSLFFALTGQPPFPDERLAGKIAGHQSRSPVPVQTRNPLVPQPLADLFDRLMRKSPNERPTDFAGVRTELRAIAELPDIATTSASVSYASVKAEALAAIGSSTGLGQADLRRADLPPASDVVDFDDVPSTPKLPTPEPVSPPSKPLPAPTVRTTLPPGLAVTTVERRMPAPTTEPRPRMTVTIPPPPAFDNAAMRAARTVMFWKKQADTVRLSGFGPTELPPGKRARLLVYAHLSNSFSGVATLGRALHPDAELFGGRYVQVPIPRDSTIQLHLMFPQGSIPKPLVEFTWSGQTQLRSFEVVISREWACGWATATVSAGWRNQKVAKVPCQLMVSRLVPDNSGV